MNWDKLLPALAGTAGDVLGRCALVAGPSEALGRAYRVRVPSGDMKYGSFWVRDAAMMAESGLIDNGEIWDWVELICLHGQNGPAERPLAAGLRVPAWAVADHINLDGGAVFYPGTMQSGDDQGDGRYGALPPHDDGYYFIDMLHRCAATAERLTTPIGGASPYERAVKALNSLPTDDATGLCRSDEAARAVDWGFCDTVVKTGLLLFPSLLRLRAARQMAELALLCGDEAGRARCQALAERLMRSVEPTFAAPDGWLWSATGRCRQPDVWGTAFAVWVGALEGRALDGALQRLARAYAEGAVASAGYIRHLPLDRDHSDTAAWEGMDYPINSYQNGGYWATPTGWYAYALSLVDRQLAEQLLTELAEHTAAHAPGGAPWEWKDAANRAFSGRFYGASAALPLAGAARIAAEGR
ncbi:MAG: hypothetical protein GX558_04455 [Clostridiales bacterium]|nr:hypothetical protein [Clostridiales bacterium]